MVPSHIEPGRGATGPCFHQVLIDGECPSVAFDCPGIMAEHRVRKSQFQKDIRVLRLDGPGRFEASDGFPVVGYSLQDGSFLYQSVYMPGIYLDGF